jgi:putative FmdB family regulatory protein
MPTKTYRCENCSFVFDNIQRFDEPNPTICPNCGHENQLVRVYKPVGVVFKGSGFYATDNKSASRVTAPNGSKPSENGQVTSSEQKKSESKAEAKTEAKTEKSSSKAE